MEPSSSQTMSLARRVSEMVTPRRKNTHPYKHHPSGFHSGENLARRRREAANAKVKNLIGDYTQHNIRPVPHGAGPCCSPNPIPATVQQGDSHVHSHPGPCHYHPHDNHQYQQPGTISLGYGMPGVSPASVIQPRTLHGFQPPHVGPRSVIPRPGYPPGPSFNRFRGPRPRHNTMHRSHRYVDDPDYDDIYPRSDDDDMFDDDDDRLSRLSWHQQPMSDDGLIPIMDPSDFDDTLSYRRERRSRDEPFWSSYR